MPRVEAATGPLARAQQARHHHHGDGADHELPARRPPSRRAMNPLRVLMLIEEGLNPPDSIEGLNEEQIAPFKTEWDVWSSLKKMGHEVQKLELHNELGAVRDAVKDFKPQIAFNLMEAFRGNPIYNQHLFSNLH